MASRRKPQGVYVELLHGRKHPDEQLSGWGIDGPIFGPYAFVQTTYGVHIRMGEEEHELFMVKGLVYYEGIYYGDWAVTASVPSSLKHRKEKWSAERAQ